jgi:hypothetical protein
MKALWLSAFSNRLYQPSPKLFKSTFALVQRCAPALCWLIKLLDNVKSAAAKNGMACVIELLS